MATATAPAIDMDRERRAAELEDQATIPRLVLEDRYAGAVDERAGDAYTRTGLKLANLVSAVIVEVARVDDGRSLAGTGGVEETVMAAIRETIIREIESRGIAR